MKAKGLHFYIRLQALAEDWGGYIPDPEELSLRMGALKTSKKEVENFLERLKSAGKTIAYEKNGREFHWLRDLLAEQPLNNPAPPKIPLPDWITWERKKYKSGKYFAIYKVNWELVSGRLPVDYQYTTSTLPVALSNGNSNSNVTVTPASLTRSAGTSGPLPDEEEEKKQLQEPVRILIEHFGLDDTPVNSKFHPVGFIMKARSQDVPIEVILKVLNSMVEQRSQITNPYAWLTDVMKKEHAEFSFQEEIKAHEKRKKFDFATIGSSLKNLIS